MSGIKKNNYELNHYKKYLKKPNQELESTDDNIPETLEPTDKVKKDNNISTKENVIERKPALKVWDYISENIVKLLISVVIFGVLSMIAYQVYSTTMQNDKEIAVIKDRIESIKKELDTSAQKLISKDEIAMQLNNLELNINKNRMDDLKDIEIRLGILESMVRKR